LSSNFITSGSTGAVTGVKTVTFGLAVDGARGAASLRLVPADFEDERDLLLLLWLGFVDFDFDFERDERSFDLDLDDLPCLRDERLLPVPFDLDFDDDRCLLDEDERFFVEAA
jgi:hypothetical protein